MKHILFTLFLSTVFLVSNAQVASTVLSTQTSPRDTSVRNVVFIGSGNRIWVAKVDSLKMYPYNMTWLKDSTLNWGDLRYPQMSIAYSNPNFVNSLSAAKVFGLSNVATTGDYNDLTSRPNMSLYYLNSNPNGYITGVTSGDVISALGYTPYNGSTNPNNYQSKTVQASNGLVKVSSATADTIEADWGLVMSVQRANDSIASIKSIINGKLNITDTTNKWLGKNYTPTNSQVISALGGTPLFSEVDGSTTNELQTLSIVNRIISLSNAGGTVTIPYQPFDSLINKPTTLSGYGITDGVTNSALNGKMNYSDTVSLSNRINTKQNQLNGTGLVRMTGATVSYDNSTYLTGITSGQVTTALGYTPLRGSDTISLSNRINAVAPSFNNTPARSLNTSFQISTTRNARVTYSITHTVNLTLVLGSGSTTAFLEISPNNSTWTEINRAGYSKTLSVAVSAGDATTNNLVGDVPAGWWCRIRVVGTGGGLTSSVPNVTYNSGQEVQY